MREFKTGLLGSLIVLLAGNIFYHSNPAWFVLMVVAMIFLGGILSKGNFQQKTRVILGISIGSTIFGLAVCYMQFF